MYIFALLGMEMFSNQIRLTWDGEIIKNIPEFVKSGGVMIAPRYNFDNIYNALVVVFCAILGEDWNNSMYSFINPGVANEFMIIAFFLLLLVLGNIMLLSLFTAILLQNFDQTDEERQAKKEKPKPEFSIKVLRTKIFYRKAWNFIVGIFDTKGKKKAKNIVEQNVSESKPDVPQEVTNMPTGKDLPWGGDKKKEEKKNVNNDMALLHYELNEAALGASVKNASVKIA